MYNFNNIKSNDEIIVWTGAQKNNTRSNNA